MSLDPIGAGEGDHIARQRRKWQRAVRESKLLFTALFRGAEIGIAVVDAGGQVIDANPALEKMLGYQAPELIGKHFLFFTHPDDAPLDLRLFNSLSTGQRDHYVVEKRFVRKDGQIIWVRLTASYVSMADGQPEFGIGLAEDITGQKEAEAQRERLLAESQYRAMELDVAISSIADAIVLVDQSGRIVRANEAARRVIGSCEDVASLPPASRPDGTPILPEDRPYAKALRGETVRGVRVIYHPGGGEELPAIVSAAPLRNERGELVGAVLTATDISKLADLERQRERHILGMSHGLRTPLTVVQGQAQMLLRRMGREAGGEPYLKGTKAILSAALRMSLTVRDLVDFTHIEAGRPLWLNKRPVDLKSFVEQLLARMESVLEIGRVRLEVEGGIPVVLADEDRLERVFLHLLGNSLKYSEPHTEVVVQVYGEGGEAVVSIRDRGRGISPESLRSLFGERPTDHKEGSLGLGVYISRGIVSAHGGRLWAESEPDRGSVFHFSLPTMAKPLLHR